VALQPVRFERGYGVPAPVRNSVIVALSPARPARAPFWIGLVLTLLALMLVACPTLLAFAIAVDPGAVEPASTLQTALVTSFCLFTGLLLPGVALMFLGRPRASR
jgi:hypothetical protein